MTTGQPCPIPFADNIKPYQALSDASSNVLIGKPVNVVNGSVVLTSILQKNLSKLI